jgi:hypothetical protein
LVESFVDSERQPRREYFKATSASFAGGLASSMAIAALRAPRMTPFAKESQALRSLARFCCGQNRYSVIDVLRQCRQRQLRAEKRQCKTKSCYSPDEVSPNLDTF